jgi:lysine 2,3-aminomutase
VTTLRTLDALVARGLLTPQDQADPALRAVADRYAIAITPIMADLIGGSPDADPIARQFLPTVAEARTQPNETADPIGDKTFEAVPGVVHRYPDRVLLKVTHACPVYCRFCFRREMVGPGGEQALDDATHSTALAYITGKPDIFEVILTGGDPFILSPRRVAELTQRLAAIPHVKVLRWHTRVPVVDPTRITPAFIEALQTRAAAVFVGIHCNHVRELTQDARFAITRLADAGIALVSQTVLLRGVNDDAETLATLFRAFVSLRIKPYYLHHADHAPGTSHFRTSIAQGQAIMRALRGRLSGLAQPTYVLDIPGGVAKVPVGPAYLDDANVHAPDGSSYAIVPPSRDT